MPAQPQSRQERERLPPGASASLMRQRSLGAAVLGSLNGTVVHGATAAIPGLCHRRRSSSRSSGRSGRRGRFRGSWLRRGQPGRLHRHVAAAEQHWSAAAGQAGLAGHHRAHGVQPRGDLLADVRDAAGIAADFGRAVGDRLRPWRRDRGPARHRHRAQPGSRGDARPDRAGAAVHPAARRAAVVHRLVRHRRAAEGPDRPPRRAVPDVREHLRGHPRRGPQARRARPGARPVAGGNS